MRGKFFGKRNKILRPKLHKRNESDRENTNFGKQNEMY
jgi:hypothetical protein